MKTVYGTFSRIQPSVVDMRALVWRLGRLLLPLTLLACNRSPGTRHLIPAAPEYVRQPGEIRLEYRPLDVPTSLHASSVRIVRVEVTNRGTRCWPARGPLSFHLGYHWTDPDRRGNWSSVVWDDGNRGALSVDVPPGGRAAISITVQAPDLAGPNQKLVIVPVLDGPGGGWTVEVPFIVSVNIL